MNDDSKCSPPKTLAESFRVIAKRQNNPKSRTIQQEQVSLRRSELAANRRSVDTQGMKTGSKTNDGQEIELATAGLSLHFSRVGDRFQMRLLVNGRALLEATAGGETEAWPAAPPLQQLHEQVLPSGPVILGVGSAGTTHWSASFAVKEPGVLWCEYAARVSRVWEPASQWLGTCWQIAEGWECSPAPSGLQLACQEQNVSLQVLGPESHLSVNQAGQIAIAPAKDFSQRSNTIQWRLAVCCR